MTGDFSAKAVAMSWSANVEVMRFVMRKYETIQIILHVRVFFAPTVSDFNMPVSQVIMKYRNFL